MSDVATLALGADAVIPGIAVALTQLLEDLVRFVTQRGLRPPVERTFDSTRDEVLKAYQYMKDQQHIGKICINVS